MLLKKPYEAVLKQDWEEMKNCYTGEDSLLRLYLPLTVHGDNAIHMAVYSRSDQPLQQFLDIADKAGELAEIIVARNESGNTALHKAAIIGNYEAAKLLVEKESKLLQIENDGGETPLFKAAMYGQTKVMMFLASQLGQITSEGKLEGVHRYRQLGDSILHVAIQGQHFGTALALLDLDHTLANANDKSGMSCLQLLAYMPYAFGSFEGDTMGFWKSILYFCLPLPRNYSDDITTDYNVKKKESEIQECPEDLERGVPVGDQRRAVVEITINDNRKASMKIRFWTFLFEEWPNMRKTWRLKKNHEFAPKLAKVLIERDFSWMDSRLQEESSANFRQTTVEGGEKNIKHLLDQRETAFFIAARCGIIEIVQEMLHFHPQAIEHYNSIRQNIFHVAVLHRQRKIFDVVKKMGIPMISLVQGIDSNGYSILHCAADSTYSIGTRSGPAYQLQDELKWSNRVHKLVPPHYEMHYDITNKRAIQIFIEEHSKQHEEAQKWIKDTVQSSSTVAVLVATVVFAAAYTVPGGSNERGLPNFLASPIFLFFTITDVVSLAGSLTSVVIFLSILSSSFEMQNFHKTLPGRLTSGFTMLFLSIATTVLTFTATIFLVISLRPRRWTATLVYGAAILPVAILALRQFPMYTAFIDTLTRIRKKIRKILPLNLLRRLFSNRGRSTKKNRA